MTRLHRLRKALGLTQAQAARRAGCSVPTWRAAEKADPAVGPWLSPKHTASLLPGIPVQAWLLDGELDQGRALCRALATDAETPADFEALLLWQPLIGQVNT